MISQNVVYIFDRTRCLKMAFYVIWVYVSSFNQQWFVGIHSVLLVVSNKTILIPFLITEHSFMVMHIH